MGILSGTCVPPSGVLGEERQKKGLSQSCCPPRPSLPLEDLAAVTRPGPCGKCQVRKWAVLPGAKGRSAGGGTGRRTPQGHRASHPPTHPREQRGPRE